MCEIPAHGEVYSIQLVNVLRHFCVFPPKIKKMTPHDRPVTDILLKVGLSTHDPFMAGRWYVPIYYLEINFPFPLLVRQRI